MNPKSSTPLGYFFREAMRRLWLSKRTSFLAIAMIAISLLILGAFLLISENLGHAIDRWQGSSRLTIYLDHDVSADQVHTIEKFLSIYPEFHQRHLISREDALKRFESYFRNLAGVVESLDENPFPPSIEIDVTQQAIQASEFDDRVAAMRRLAGVDDIQFEWEWIGRLRNLVNMINLIGLVAGGLLAIAAAFTIANVIRLTVELYREEVDIMRLVGATESTIRGPFFVEGLLQGTIGGILAVGLLYALFVGARTLVGPSSALIWDSLLATFLSWEKSAGLIGGGIFAGVLGSWLALRGYSEEQPMLTAESSEAVA
jgi:cell division transport system permease protein